MCVTAACVNYKAYNILKYMLVTGAREGVFLSGGPAAAFKGCMLVFLPTFPCKDSYLCYWNRFKEACIQTAPSCWEIINIFSLSAAHYGQHTLITGWIYGALRPYSPKFGQASAGTGFEREGEDDSEREEEEKRRMKGGDRRTVNWGK